MSTNNQTQLELRYLDTLSQLQTSLEKYEIAEGLNALCPPTVALEAYGLEASFRETIKDSLSRVYIRFLDAMVKVWDYAVAFFDTTYAQVAQLLSKLESVSDDAKDRVPSKPIASTVTLPDKGKVLSHNYKTLDPKSLITELRTFPTLIDGLVLDHVSRVNNASKFIMPLVESLLKADLSKEGVLQNIQTDARAVAKFGNEVSEYLGSLPGTDVTGYRDDLANGLRVREYATLVGNKSVFVRTGTIDKAALRGVGIPFFTALSTVFNSALLLSETNPNGKPPSDTLPTLSPSDVMSIASVLEDALKGLHRFKIRHGNEIKEQRKRYQRLRGDLSVVARNGDNNEATLYLRRVGVALMGLSKWYYDPFIPTISHTLRVTRAAVEYCEKSLAKWPVK